MSEKKLYEIKVKLVEIFEETCKMKHCHVKPRRCSTCIAMTEFKKRINEL